MKSYLLKVGGRDESPYSEEQIAQMFADQRVNRATPCKSATGGEWKTLDEYLPTLKYGAQLPAPSSTVRNLAATTGPTLQGTNVAITELDVPFGSVLKMAFKIFGAWLIVAVCFAPIAIILWFFIMAIVLSFFGHTFSGLDRR